MSNKAQPKSVPEQSQAEQPGSERAMHPAPDFMPRYPGAGRLDGKTVIITGGDSGIGRAVAVAMAREGAQIVISYLREHADAEDTLKAIEKEGGMGLLLPGDITSEGFCEKVVKDAQKHFGTVDVLINNAAEQHETNEPLEIEATQLQRTFETNLFSMFHMSKHALRHMGEQSAIINTASVTAYRGSEALIDYASTKGAIVAFTRSLASALASRKIRVNAVAPGPIWTPLIPASFDAEKVSKFGTDTPLGRAGQPNEVAPCYVFLACQDSSYMTGQVLHPNGGIPVES
jgi:NAD(P)-dependent dehydrogenase (short-subunit alcohol dehydrogenase family)